MIIERSHLDRRALLFGMGALSLPLGLSACASEGSLVEVAPRGLDRLPMTQDVLNRFVAAGRLPGLAVGVALPEGGKAFVQAGTLDFGSFTRVDRDSLFRIYSMTKLITGAAAAILMEEGKFGLDTPVADFIPEFASMKVATNPARGLSARPAQNVMTIRHLLTHTSGFTYAHAGDSAVQREYARQGIFMAASSRGGVPLPSNYDELVARLADIPLMFEPGTKYEYGISIDVLAVVIERAAGVPFADFVQQRILDPLAMQDTVWRLREGNAERLAAIYNYGPTGTGQRAAVPNTSAADLSRPVPMPFAGSGLLSTASDYIDFLAMLLNDGAAGRRRIMKPETARLMRSDILPAGLSANDGGHGFGGWVAREGHKRAGEFGWSGNASTQAWIDPAHNFAAVLMMQALPYRSVNVLSELRVALDADLGISR
ncbi:serine hydrolase domain-containing protein [uncultured Brevundimonas sp.]|uniref:serine hydrolase domain-containing protein n=1 Tax=uncultured Brevundimonas sp. TaxID=213418 RepID=UPI002612BCEE|nr:serine hydrolase domain-containing protein [uncultured Brevundimonas sp.]